MPDRPKKLIEVALPLEAINKESAREKSIRHGHPSTLHLWWARRPLASCRAVLFASLVDDPSAHPDRFPTEEAQEQERRRLLEIIEQLVKWENANNPDVLKVAQAEIMRSTNNNPPPVLDPFCGGGSIPLEVQRLGLEAHASDINPVAVLITKALIEIPPKFKDQAPVNPEAQKKLKTAQWFGAQGLAEDVRYYGKWIRDRAEERIGHLYPKVKLPKEYGEGEATVIAWLWARTVKCPNPACGCQMPLVKSFELSTKKGKAAWVEPAIDRTQKPPVVNFKVKTGEGKAPEPPKLGRGAKFRCLACEQPVEDKHIKAEGIAGRMGAKLMAIVAEGTRGRIYLEPTKEHEEIAFSAQPSWKPEVLIGNDRRSMFTPLYGLKTFGDLFTDRQLVTLTTLSDLVKEARKQICRDAAELGGAVEEAYADAVVLYLSMAISKLSDYLSNICTWRSDPKNLGIGHVFARQAIPMVWDYAEANPFSKSSGNFLNNIEWITLVVKQLNAEVAGKVKQQDATKFIKDENQSPLVFTTDPPYYDNISYAELADFFYVWLRRSLEEIYPALFGTVATPKEGELVAAPYRFGGSKEKAQQFFEEGLREAFQRIYAASNTQYPFTVFYAFKQTESVDDVKDGLRIVASTGWETMLESLLKSGFSVTGTWPMRTELGNRVLGQSSNALASSIALVCRPLPADAPKTTRRNFVNELKRELPAALRAMQQGNIAPVDLAQASIGPGMAVFSRYKQVLESDGTPMRVRTALQLINQTLDEYFTEQEGEFDADTRWALTWFEQHQFEDGSFGDAETLSKAKVTSVQGLASAGILAAKAGKVRLLRRDELPQAWNPATDLRVPVWEATQHLIHALDRQGESGAAKLLGQLGDRGQFARDLAYRLYSICDRKGWTQEAIAYNSLVTSWSEISRLTAHQLEKQGTLALGI